MSLQTPSYDQALVVDLNREDAESQESDSDALATLPVSSGQESLTGQPDTSSQSEVSDLGPVGQDEAPDSEAGPAADLNLRAPTDSVVVLGGTVHQALSDTPEAYPDYRNTMDEPVTVQAPAEASPRGPPAAGETAVSQIIFIDSAVDASFPLKNAGLPGVAVILLDTGRDGIRQITDILSGYRNLSAIHIISHGTSGQVILGAATPSPSSLNRYADDLSAWGASLAEEGDILLYGCSIAAGQEGQALIQGFANLTGADVAASNDPTGTAELGGDWILETATGPIEASLPNAQALVALDALLAAGDLDTTFGTGGIVTTSFGTSPDYGRAVAIQSDGKIVVAGDRSADFAVLRYNVDGSLDTSFGTDGKVVTPIGSGSDYGYGVTLQSDGKIVVAGLSHIDNTWYFAVARYNPDGSLDTSFDGDGVVTTAIGPVETYGYAVALQSDGKIIVAGSSVTSGTNSDFALVRYNTDGSLDTSFDGDGKVTTNFGSSGDYGYSVAIQSDGKIVVAGASSENFAVARYNTDGSLDTSFDGDGKATTPIGSGYDCSYSVAIQSDGKIVVAGGGYITGTRQDIAVVRYNTDGSPDTSFDGDGKVTTAIGSGDDYGRAAAIQSDGKIVVAGHSRTSNTDVVVVRYNTDGSLDTSFDADGKVITGIGSLDEYGYGMALQSDGKIAVAGITFPDLSNVDVAVLRYIGARPTTPEITVLGSGVAVTDGDTTPSAADGTDFASVIEGNPPISRTFMVRNDGEGSLTLGTATLPEGYTMTEGLSASLAPGESDTFTVQLDTATIGTKSGEISFSTNDPEEDPFNFTITGIVRSSTQEITVLGNGIVIVDDDTGPDAADGTDFGSMLQGTAAISRTFTVRNDGGSTLVLGAVIVPTGFTVTEGLSASLAMEASDTFTVRLDTATAGTKTGDISFATNDSDESPFNFQITGTVLPAPDITVLYNGVSITDGDATPSANDGTDFGSTGPGVSISHTFTVRNDGDVMLTLGTVSIPAGFTLTEGLSASLAPGASDTFTVQLDTAALGTKAGDVSFSTNDSDEDPFNFQITGRVLAPGNLDPAFGTGGIVATNMGFITERALTVAIQSDGKIVAAGYAATGMHYLTVARYNADGSLDTSFDGDGTVLTTFGSAHWVGHGVAVQSDGKIVVAGYAYTSGGSTYDDFAVVRYNADGSLDASFGAGGGTTTDFGSTSDNGYSMVLQSDGKIVVAGRSGTGSTYNFALARYNTDGSLDTSFDGDGKVTTAVGSSSQAYSVALQSDGKIVVAGESGTGTYDFALARYNPDGSLDTSFDGDGKVTTPFGSPSRVRRVALQSDGKIVVAGESGTSTYSVALARYSPDGSLDASFDGDGRVTTAVGTSSRAYGVALQSDGKIVVAGSSDGDFAVVRYNGNGSLDTSFSGDGKVTTNREFDGGYSVALQSDGKIVVAGESGSAFAVVRYIGSVTTAAEITVLGNGVSIRDGDATPSLGDGTDYRYATLGEGTVSRTFTVHNDGVSTLTMGAVTVPTGYTLTEALVSSLDPGASDTFTVQLDTATPGIKSGEITFSNDDADENPFSFAIRGRVLALPEITVLGNGISIADGDTTPDPADNTDFGSVLQGTGPISRIFTVRNDGELTLTLGAVTLPAGFTLWGSLPSSLAGGASGYFTVRLDTATVGTKTGDISFATNDSDENLFNFTITATVLPAPEITVLGNGISIADGDSTPSADDGTDFGWVLAGEAVVSHTFTVRNDGTAALTLGTVTIPPGYTVMDSLSASLAPGESDTFTIQLDTVTLGTKTGEVSFATNDPDENPFNFQIAGRVLGPGDLDPSFGNAGKVVTTVGSFGGDYGRAVALQPDGKIIVAGYSFSVPTDDFAVVRYNPDGSLDTSFDGDGKVITAIGSSHESGRSVTVQPDGKIVVAGYSYNGTNDDFAVVRYNADGSLDTSFDGDGKVTTAIGAGNDWGRSVAIQSDGKILVAGRSASGSIYTFAVVRYNPDGSLDTSFDGDGKLTTAIGSSSQGYRVVVQSDGKIVVVGESDYNVALVRYNSDGSLDASFGVGGKVTTDLGSSGSSGDYGYSAVLQPDGKIVVSGMSNYDFAVVRYQPDGSLDTSFDGDGKVTTDLGSNDMGVSVVLQPDGKIVVAGLNGTAFSVARYNVDGSLDTSFSGDGKVNTGGGAGYGVAVQSDGRMVVAGESSGMFAAVRYLGDAPANAEITLLRDGLSITDGDTTPGTADGTDFGSVSQYEAAISRVFTVRNDGTSTLALGTVSVPAGFTVTEGLSTTLAPGESDTFTVQLDTAVAGPKTGDVSFSTNDYDENPFNFRITGVVVGAGNLALSRPTTASTSYTGLPASNATDGNVSSRWSSLFSDNEWIYVDLGWVYRINRVVLQWEAAYGRGYKLQVSNDASTWSDAYSTTTGDGGVDDITLAAPAYGRYVRMLGTQRATAYGYSLYELEIYGGAPAPEVTVLGNGISIADGDATPGTTDGTDFGSVVQGAAAISRTFTVRNDGGSALTLGAVTVPTGFTLAETLASSLAPGASDTFTVQLDTAAPGTKTGEITFSNDDGDQNPFNFTITGTVLTPAEIAVLGNGVVIADGDTTPSTADDTDFGSVLQGAPGISRTFTVRNDGESTLTLGTMAVPPGFTLTEGLSASLAAGTMDTFTVRLDTAIVGTTTGEVSFATNDSDEDPFDFTITGTVLPVPEITVLGNGVSIADGDMTPGAGDGTDFGSVVQGEAAVSRTFTVRNDGTAALTLGAVTVPVGFTLTEELASSLDPGASDTFTVRLDTTMAATKAGEISFTTNDADENPFNFAVSGTVTSSGRIVVDDMESYNDTDHRIFDTWIDGWTNGTGSLVGYLVAPFAERTIVHGGFQSMPLQYDNTAMPYYSEAYRTFTTAQDWTTGGAGVLSLWVRGQSSNTANSLYVAVQDTAGHMAVVTHPSTTLVQTTTWTEWTMPLSSFSGVNMTQVHRMYLGIGNRSSPSADGGGRIFVDDITLVQVGPEIAVLGNGISIIVGDTTPSAADGTDFGSVAEGDPALGRVFTVRNEGGATLTLGAVTVPEGFTLTEGLSASLAPAAEDTFTVQLDTAAAGIKSGDVSFSTNDSDENPFHFQVTGTVIGAGNLALSKPATASTSYAGLPASNATDGNLSSRWSSQFSDNEWIYVDLGSAYTISRVVLSWEAAYGRGYKIQVSSDASTWSDVYSTTTGDGGVDDITLASSASGRYVRMLGTQRGTMYGYSLWEFEVYGGTPTNHAPAVSSFSKSLMQDTPLPLAAADFTAAFTDPDAGDSLQKIKITSLPTQGVLALNSTAVTLNQEIPTAQIGTLVYTPHSGYTGFDSFQWNGSDENLYAATGAAVNLSITAAAANLALGKAAAASTSYSGFPASNVTDGNVNSRWSSEFSDSEWIYVDLGSVHTVNRVVLRWEAAYGRGYKIQVSNDAGSWSDVYTTTAGDGGVDDVTLAAPASGRYVRMLGTQRATQYGYSLYELEVYGGGGGTGAEITVLGNDVSIADGDATPSPADGTDFGWVVQGSPAVTRTFTVRNDGTADLTLGAVTVPWGFILTEGLSSSLAPGASDTFTVRLNTSVPDSYWGNISFTTNDSDENPFNFQISGTVDAINLALGKTTVASTSYTGFPASSVTDGNLSSRWSSQFSDSEWIYVDLGAVFTINQVVLRWEVAYGRGYTIQVLSDASTWSDVYSTTTGDGGVDDITLASPASGRYVRLLGTQRGTAYGYSLWEFEVYG